MFLNGYPYTDFHEMNLDFLLKSMETLKQAFADFTASNSLIFAEPLLFDITKSYAKNTIVLDPDGNAYISIQNVPEGVQLSNADYWLMVFNFEEYTEKANKNFTVNYFRDTTRSPYTLSVGDWCILDDVLYTVTQAIAADEIFIIGTNITHFTVEQFLKDFVTSVNNTLSAYNNTIQQYKNDIDASELLYRQQLAQDIANTTASLQAQLDAAISGATVDSEVINARIGEDGVTYPTLGDAIRTQVGNLKSKVEEIRADLVGVASAQWNLGGSTIAGSASNRCKIFNCLPNTKYVIKRSIITHRFVVGTTAASPTIGSTILQKIINNTGDTINIETNSGAYCIVVWFYNTNEDSLIASESDAYNDVIAYNSDVIFDTNENTIAINDINQKYADIEIPLSFTDGSYYVANSETVTTASSTAEQISGAIDVGAYCGLMACTNVISKDSSGCFITNADGTVLFKFKTVDPSATKGSYKKFIIPQGAKYLYLSNQNIGIVPKLWILSPVRQRVITPDYSNLTRNINDSGVMQSTSGYSCYRYKVVPDNIYVITSKKGTSNIVFANTLTLGASWDSSWFISKEVVTTYNKANPLVIPEDVVMMVIVAEDDDEVFVEKIDKKPIPVIIDTDMSTDIDDMFALKVAITEEAIGNIDIAFINLSTQNASGIMGIDGLMEYYGINDMPISRDNSGGSASSAYLPSLALYNHFYYRYEDSMTWGDAYREAIRKLNFDEKIDIICIGNCITIANLLQNDAAEVTPKIRRIYLMGGRYPSGQEYNFCGQNNGSTDLKTAWVSATNYLLTQTDIPIYIVPFEVGLNVLTGDIYQNEPDSLEYKAITAYNSEVLTTGRPSWDPITVLIASEKLGNNNVTWLRGTMSIDTTTGINSFAENSTGNHHVCVIVDSVILRHTLKKKINDLLSMPVATRNNGNRMRLTKKHSITPLINYTLNWTGGTYYDEHGNIQYLDACSSAEVDVSSYINKLAYIRTSSHGATYCVFKDSDGNVLQAFQTDETIQGYRTQMSIRVPATAKKLCISNQRSVVPTTLCYIKILDY